MNKRVDQFKSFLSKLKGDSSNDTSLVEAIEQAFKICLENELDDVHDESGNFVGELAPGVLTNYELLSHGVEGEQYFQGAGTSFTKFKHIATGMGNSEKEAFDDALEQIAQEHEVEFSKIEKDGETLSTKVSPEVMTEDSDMHYYFSVRYNLPKPVYISHVDSPSLEDEGKRLGSYTESSNEPIKKEKCRTKKCGKDALPSYATCQDCLDKSHTDAERATRVESVMYESKNLMESSFVLRFSVENNAFEGENLGFEIARILKEVASKTEASPYSNLKVFDQNGNHIGTAGLTR